LEVVEAEILSIFQINLQIYCKSSASDCQITTDKKKSAKKNALFQRRCGENNRNVRAKLGYRSRENIEKCMFFLKKNEIITELFPLFKEKYLQHINVNVRPGPQSTISKQKR